MAEAGERESLTLKWGTLKGWSFHEDGPAMAAFRRYCEQPVSMGAMSQRDTPEQRQAICDIIDALDADTVYLDWDAKDVSKDEAKEYVLGYRS